MVSVALDVCHRGGWKVQLGHEALKQANTPIVVGRPIAIVLAMTGWVYALGWVALKLIQLI
jgi:hypothetical protein